MVSALGLRLLGLGLALAALGFGVWWIYDNGKEAGENVVHAQWDKAKREAQAENEKARAEGYKLAAEYIIQLRELETRYGRTSARLRDALNAPAVCPASGRLGDLVVPAAVVDGMFLRDSGSPAAPGPSASQPDRAVR